MPVLGDGQHGFPFSFPGTHSLLGAGQVQKGGDRVDRKSNNVGRWEPASE